MSDGIPTASVNVILDISLRRDSCVVWMITGCGVSRWKLRHLIAGRHFNESIIRELGSIADPASTMVWIDGFYAGGLLTNALKGAGYTVQQIQRMTRT